MRPGAVAAAAVLIGGALVLALPQYAVSIVRLVIVTAAAAAALYLLGVQAPATWWTSPLDRRRARDGRRRDSDGLDAIRAALSGRRQRIGIGQALPPETVRLLQPLIADALDRDNGRGAGGPAGSARDGLSPLTRAVLDAAPLRHPPLLRTLRPDAAATAAAVHHVLDELDRLTEHGGARRITTPTPSERAR